MLDFAEHAGGGEELDQGLEVAPPPWPLLLGEGRALYEVGLFYQALPALLAAERGDGHTVLVLPGFTASDLSTSLLRSYLRRQGYDARGWTLGRNLGFSTQLETRMARRLQSLHWRSGRKVSLVGWSLGGIFARELARLHPEMVRQVITLGSPFAASPRATNVWRLYERIAGQRVEDIDPELLRRMRRAPPVPSTAVYSRSDGIASWRACLEPEAPHTDNVRVPGSHCGLGHNPWAVFVIADRLAQQEGGWQPFDRRGMRRLVFPAHARAARRR
jgi:pimeloyl-ACP methyl ester carboxylesterase